MSSAGKLGAVLILFAGITPAYQDAPQRVAIPAVPADAIHVRVVDPEGRPVPDVELFWRELRDEREAPEQGLLLLGSTWQRLSTRTGADGLALLTGGGAGAWRIAAGGPPEWGYHFSAVTRAGARAGYETLITLTPLPRDCVLSGVVLQPDGVPETNTDVRFVWDDRGIKGEVQCNTDGQGRFVLLAGAPGVVGALHAVETGRAAFRSTALDPVAAGSTEIELRLGELRYVKLDVRDQQGRPVEPVNASIYLHLAGQTCGYPRRYSRRPRKPPWELPPVPFEVVVRGDSSHREVRVGPFDPATVGSTLTIEQPAYPRLRGRVTKDGAPVAGAKVSLRSVDEPRAPDVEMTRVLRRIQDRTDAAGRFDFPLRSSGIRTCELSAWDPELGEGSLGPLELDPAVVHEELDIEITRAPGNVVGRVILPAERQPAEVWLVTNVYRGYLPLAPDGTFLLSGFPPGRATIWIREGYGSETASLPASTTVSRRPGEAWLQLSHGPVRAPAWLPAAPAFDVEVRAGETVEIELDLVEEAACRLAGRILLDGEPPPYRPSRADAFDYIDSGFTVHLDRGREYEDVSGTNLAPDGTFVLRANVPGTYRVRFTVPTAGEEVPKASTYDWLVLDRVRLDGVHSWEHDIPTGSLRVLPRDVDGNVIRFPGKLRWEGPGDLRIFVRYGDRDRATREVFYPTVPAGRIQLFHDAPEGRVTLLEAEVRPGETTTVRLP